MKKIALLLLLAGSIVSLNAQDVKKVFGSPTLVWYGTDFTLAKMVGFGDESPTKIKDECFKPWNEIVIDMDLAKVFQKSGIYRDLVGVNKQNLARETMDLKSNEEVEFKPEVIAERVKQLVLGQKKEGLGALMIVQSFDKNSGFATVHVVFFDIASRGILWSKKMTGKSTGGATLKAWTGALKDVFSQIEKKEFKAWKIEANY
ncbi:MAG: hypothetical protein KIS94_11525 [Chitinophagales bacterium]|nr:hypothetical protein [Chitinophagales bacterium]